MLLIVLLNLYLANAYKVYHTVQQEHSQNGNNGGELHSTHLLGTTILKTGRFET